MAAGLGVLLGLGIVGLVLGSSSSGSSTTGGGGGGGAAGLECAKWIAMLPDTATTPTLKQTVNAAMFSTVMTKSDYEDMAKALDIIQTTPGATADQKAGARGAAACLRDRAKSAPTGGVGGGPPAVDVSKMTCEQAFALLPPEVQTAVMAARVSGTPALLTAAADTIDTLAAASSDLMTKAVYQLASKCLRAGAGGVGSDVGKPGAGSAHVDENGVLSTLSGTAPRTNVASNPNFQWIHTVLTGQNASVITREIFGSGTTTALVDELINNNPREQKGRVLGPIRRDWPAGTPGQTPGVLNWTSLRTGDRLRLPKSWDAWISEDGDPRGAPTPWPKA